MQIHTKQRYTERRTRFTAELNISPNRNQTRETTNMNGTHIERCIINKKPKG